MSQSPSRYILGNRRSANRRTHTATIMKLPGEPASVMGYDPKRNEGNATDSQEWATVARAWASEVALRGRESGGGLRGSVTTRKPTPFGPTPQTRGWYIQEPAIGEPLSSAQQQPDTCYGTLPNLEQSAVTACAPGGVISSDVRKSGLQPPLPMVQRQFFSAAYCSTCCKQPADPPASIRAPCDVRTRFLDIINPCHKVNVLLRASRYRHVSSAEALWLVFTSIILLRWVV